MKLSILHTARLTRVLFTLVSIVLVSSCKSSSEKSTEDSIQAPRGYELIWHDEFDSGDKPNAASWSYEEGFVRNEELQWYQKDNASVAQGNLVITGRKEKIPNPNFKADATNWKQNRQQAEYTSSSINTRGKFQFKYGILEVRAKIDTASGMWPAIWTLGVEKGWPSNGEIDVMEFYQIGGKPHILANAAWGPDWRNVSWDSAKIPFSEFIAKDPQWAEKFHIWKMDWTSEFIKLYLDDELLNEIDLADAINPDGSNGFQQPHYILLNLAIGSNGGDPSKTEFPKEYLVDYVRVYQKTDQNQ
ncbi:glycoside hydrolase family 16 protein [Leeuwenhoekiella palythoae]|uniref:Beta-glucanase (GH16 family) n=1 Tax=Leeuwenhoekiella palythoae TaxID=573501 RepID=A0A1M5Y2F0_9FLAO|nr:glycoside hydrolase family 16 protein [Leeuwenhoekiella palythoae]MAS20077.1 beta-glucanase [Leeuwenhoekiella sp.]RXG30417.1 beta-glucanase (GH16 family) [Leeuwenhoekiella palythoae]UBZ10569.1 glycoside hydrolase family 16 protein [Leeuwenhoekiella palythoae]SHI05974.1 Beta-glucanase, GH16 family [Leeuwenhoekiella palythoae]HAX14149.1 glycoside hydrolase family 16 protein [Leeuwenhoekiella sp.]